jgi:PPM family protein phosphatase
MGDRHPDPGEGRYRIEPRDQRCPRCGYAFSPEGQFCEGCGALLSDGSSEEVGDTDHRERDLNIVAGVCDRGLRHATNEDAMGMAIVGTTMIAVVCDGVSSTPGSDRASIAAARTATAVLADTVRRHTEAAQRMGADASGGGGGAGGGDSTGEFGRGVLGETARTAPASEPSRFIATRQPDYHRSGYSASNDGLAYLAPPDEVAAEARLERFGYDERRRDPRHDFHHDDHDHGQPDDPLGIDQLRGGDERGGDGRGGDERGGDELELPTAPSRYGTGAFTPAHAERALHAATVAAQAAVARVPAVDGRIAPSCTLAAAIVTRNPDGTATVTVGWVGDSRVYVLGPEWCERLTTDDTWAVEAARAGLIPASAVETDRRAHTLTRWLGADAEADNIAPHVAVYPVRTPVTVLVCTDGLWNYVSRADEMAGVVDQLQPAAPAIDVARHLTNHALRRGGHDNVTVVAVRFDEWPPEAV